MKRYLLLLAFCAGCFVSGAAELSEDELEHLQDTVKIRSVADETIRGADREKSEQIKINTNQRQDDDQYNFRIKIVVELTDKSKNTYYTSMAGGQGETNSEYIGEDTWMFTLPHGTLEKPKLTAYVIQYGILQDDGTFVVLAEEMDDVDTLEELTKRSPTLLEQKAVLEHMYSFEDGDGEVQSSGWDKAAK